MLRGGVGNRPAPPVPPFAEELYKQRALAVSMLAVCTSAVASTKAEMMSIPFSEKPSTSSPFTEPATKADSDRANMNISR